MGTDPAEAGPIALRTSRLGLALGLAVAAGGVALGVLYVRGWSLSLGGLGLPRWTLVLAGVLAVGFGLLLAQSSRLVPHCRSCGRELQPALLLVSVDAAEQAAEAVAAQDVAALAQLPRSGAAGSLDLRVAVCPYCRRVALVRLGGVPRLGVAGEIWEGEPAAALAQLIQKT